MDAVEANGQLMAVDLTTLSRAGNAPFSVVLNDGSGLELDAIVRRVANKRLVCVGQWQGQRVYAKLFIGEQAKRYAQRDAQGINALTAANILTPPLLMHTQSGQTEVLIFAAINDAENAEAIWTKIDKKSQLALAKKLVITLAQHHNAGLLQTDLYFKNFLIQTRQAQGKTIYTLDGDGIRQFSQLSDENAMQNLCVLLSKFDVIELEKWAASLVETYYKARAWPILKDHEHENDLANIIDVANQHRLKVTAAYADKKVFRQCTDVNIISLHGLYVAASSDIENIDFSEHLDAYIGAHDLLKNGNTCTVAQAEMNGKQVVIKRYNIKNFWHGVSRAFRQTRAAKSWANAHRLKLLGIATAKPVALIENRTFGFLNGKAYFLAEYIDAPDVAQYFAQTQDKAQRAEAVKNIVELFYRLFLLQISHGDMKATNIKMVDSKPVLIDLDSMRQHRSYSTSSVAHLKDLHRFMQNWQADIALYNAFVKTFKVVYPDTGILVKAGIYANKSIQIKR